MGELCEIAHKENCRLLRYEQPTEGELDSIAKLAESLFDDPDLIVRRSAYLAYALAKGKDSIPLLRKGLKDPKPFVRIQIPIAAYHIICDESHDFLVELAGHKEGYIAKEAKEGLEHFKRNYRRLPDGEWVRK